MKHIWMVNLLVLLIALVSLPAESSKGGEVVETNAMPAEIQNLMETEGYTMTPTVSGVPVQNTNFQRNIRLAERTQFIPFELPKKKASWNPWDNSSIRHVGRTGEPIDPFAPPFGHYEYDITYSFTF